jgi:hypothetical protein
VEAVINSTSNDSHDTAEGDAVVPKSSSSSSSAAAAAAAAAAAQVRPLLCVLSVMSALLDGEEDCAAGAQQCTPPLTGSQPQPQPAISAAHDRRMDACEVVEACVQLLCTGVPTKQEGHISGSSSVQQQVQPQLLWLARTGLRLGQGALRSGHTQMGARALVAAAAACQCLLGSAAVMPAPDITAACRCNVAAATAAAAVLLLNPTVMQHTRTGAAAAGTGRAAAAAEARVLNEQLARAQRLLIGARKALSALHARGAESDSSSGRRGAAVASASGELEIAQLELVAACSSGDAPSARRAVQSLAALPSASLQHLLAAAAACLSSTALEQQAGAAIAVLAYGHTLRLAAAAEPPAAGVAAAAAAALMRLAASHAVRLHACTKLADVLRRGALAAPLRASNDDGHLFAAVSWIVASAWNWSLRLADGRPRIALQFLERALDLASALPLDTSQSQCGGGVGVSSHCHMQLLHRSKCEALQDALLARIQVRKDRHLEQGSTAGTASGGSSGGQAGTASAASGSMKGSQPSGATQPTGSAQLHQHAGSKHRDGLEQGGSPEEEDALVQEGSTLIGVSLQQVQELVCQQVGADVAAAAAAAAAAAHTGAPEVQQEPVSPPAPHSCQPAATSCTVTPSHATADGPLCTASTAGTASSPAHSTPALNTAGRQLSGHILGVHSAEHQHQHQPHHGLQGQHTAAEDIKFQPLEQPGASGESGSCAPSQWQPLVLSGTSQP